MIGSRFHRSSTSKPCFVGFEKVGHQMTGSISTGSVELLWRLALALHAQVYSQTPVVLGVPRPHVRMYRQADEACPRVAHKTGTYRRPRLFILAALVPSAGTLEL